MPRNEGSEWKSKQSNAYHSQTLDYEQIHNTIACYYTFTFRTSTNVQQRVHASHLRTVFGVGMVLGEPFFQEHADLLPTRLVYSGIHGACRNGVRVTSFEIFNLNFNVLGQFSGVGAGKCHSSGVSR